MYVSVWIYLCIYYTFAFLNEFSPIEINIDVYKYNWKSLVKMGYNANVLQFYHINMSASLINSKIFA